MSATSSTTSPSSSLLRGQLFRTNTGAPQDNSPSAPLLNQLEELMRYNEAQRQLIQDMYSAAGLCKLRPSSSHPLKTTNTTGEKPSNDDLPATVVKYS
jgi:hypothetical protein